MVTLYLQMSVNTLLGKVLGNKTKNVQYAHGGKLAIACALINTTYEGKTVDIVNSVGIRGDCRTTVSLILI